MSFIEYYQQRKAELKKENLERSLRFSSGIDFCSNDYLSFSNLQEIKNEVAEHLVKYPVGSTGSRLLRGQVPLVKELEHRMAKISGKEKALLFPSGYQANLALFSTLLKNNSIVFSDQYNHASIIDGIRLSGCEKEVFSHLNLDDLISKLNAHKSSSKKKFVVVESVYSMHGDRSPLDELVSLCQDHGAELIVDEAHASGLYGDKGSGLVEDTNLEDQVFARIHTLGKAYGVSGAWISGGAELIDYLVNFARPFIYTTGPCYPQILSITAALNAWQKFGQRRSQEYLARVEEVRSILRTNSQSLGIKIGGDGSPIISYQVGRNENALEFMNQMNHLGFDVRAIRPPTVPKGQAMLRVTIPWERSDLEVQKFVENLTSIAMRNVQ